MQERADVARKRHRWRNWQTRMRPERLVFIDETGAKTNMARLRGRSPRGRRLNVSLPWGHWKTTTFVAGLRTTGLTAPMVLDRAKAAATTIDDLWNALAEAIDQFQPDECWNYIKNSEYGSN